MRTGYYPGSFDPVTNGHVDVIARACGVVDKLVLAVGVSHTKKPFLPAETRVALLQQVAEPIGTERGCEIAVETFDNLVVDAARVAGASILIRGLRDATDYAYEMQMAGMNGELAPDIETVFLPASGPVRHIASSLVKQIASMGGDISGFVPDIVADAIAKN
ncbi:MAG: pantetheine-phosphate adenylyltransferase [Rhizobiales bacterium]|nr:pantetheine-phosphate adenylyltransferase [Hyphomicrobiales bacterium]